MYIHNKIHLSVFISLAVHYYIPISALENLFCVVICAYTYVITAVWGQFFVENIHMKIICCKKISSLLESDENSFTVKFFTIEFFQFKLVAISPVSVGQDIKMEVCERNRCICVTITTRDAVTGEEQLKSLNAKGKIMKASDG